MERIFTHGLQFQGRRLALAVYAAAAAEESARADKGTAMINQLINQSPWPHLYLKPVVAVSASRLSCVVQALHGSSCLSGCHHLPKTDGQPWFTVRSDESRMCNSPAGQCSLIFMYRYVRAVIRCFLSPITGYL